LRMLGLCERALAIEEDAFPRRRRVLGDYHWRTLRSAHNLAADLRALKRTREASEWESWIEQRQRDPDSRSTNRKPGPSKQSAPLLDRRSW
jgi:hypothetical protein